MPACTSRSSGWRSSTSASASARTSTTASSRASTRSACRSRTCPSSSPSDPDEVERRVERAIDTLHLTIRDIRNFIFGLRPELLERGDLLTGSPPSPRSSATRDRRRRARIVEPMDCRARRRRRPRICCAVVQRGPQQRRAALAGPRGRSVWISAEPRREPSLEIEDDGRGFDPAGGREPGHQGLANMRSRVATVGGDHGHRQRRDRHADRDPPTSQTGTDADEEDRRRHD